MVLRKAPTPPRVPNIVRRINPIATGGSTKRQAARCRPAMSCRENCATAIKAVAAANGSATATATEEIFRLSSSASLSPGVRNGMEPPRRL